MTPGLTLYRLATWTVSPAIGLLLRSRIKGGKEDPARRNERLARDLPPRPEGPLVWLHGASVGESLMLAAVGDALVQERPGLSLLFTSQTQTSARLLAERLPPGALHQMAPIDTPAIAQRFTAHWRPDLLIVAEGDIWPNALLEAKQSGAALALINARMTEKSLSGWRRWPGTAKQVFGAFDVALAADDRTAEGLSGLLERPIETPGNLKSALPPPAADETELKRLRASFVGDRSCLLAASTHDGEEALALEAWSVLDPRPALIIAPRHPERGDEVAALLARRDYRVARRSHGQALSANTDVLLADTLGEMGLWYRLATTIYLGGGHAKGIGGHNPLEPVQLGKRVITGPDVFNFDDVFAELEACGAAERVADAPMLALAIEMAPTAKVDIKALADFRARSRAPLAATLDALLPLLPAPAQ